MQIKADLHTHTTCSDGIKSPQKLIELALEKGLTHLSITDHDTVDAYKVLDDVTFKENLRIIPGVEATTMYQGKECHLLVYGNGVFTKHVSDQLYKTRSLRIERAEAIRIHLSSMGIPLEMDELRAEAHFGSIGRPHFAQLLVKKGWVGSVQEAFYRYLSDNHIGQFRPNYPELLDFLAILKPLNVLSFLAHPKTRFVEQELREFKQHGLSGIEVYHPSHSSFVIDYLSTISLKLGLAQSGGSDFHGTKTSCTENFGSFVLEEPVLMAFLSQLPKN